MNDISCNIAWYCQGWREGQELSSEWARESLPAPLRNEEVLETAYHEFVRTSEDWNDLLAQPPHLQAHLQAHGAASHRHWFVRGLYDALRRYTGHDDLWPDDPNPPLCNGPDWDLECRRL